MLTGIAVDTTRARYIFVIHKMSYVNQGSLNFVCNSHNLHFKINLCKMIQI